MRPLRRLHCLSAIAALVVCPMGLLAEQSVQETLNRVEVLLTTAPTLSTSARASMIDEAASIWLKQGVVLEWLQPNVTRPVAAGRLRALIVQKRLSTNGSPAQAAIGELIRPENGHPIALISIEIAQHMVSSRRGSEGAELIAVNEMRLGIVLGRALAHEIGHHLLDTPTHARSGLMRPRFNAFELTDLRDGTFALDRDAASWLRTRGAQKFAYMNR